MSDCLFCKIVDQEIPADIVYEDDFSCPQLYQRIVIGSDGKVMMCSNDEDGKALIGDANEQTIQEKVQSLADYGVRFSACGNTMKSLNWSENDLFDFVEVVPVGVEALIDFQARGFAYISW